MTCWLVCGQYSQCPSPRLAAPKKNYHGSKANLYVFTFLQHLSRFMNVIELKICKQEL